MAGIGGGKQVCIVGKLITWRQELFKGRRAEGEEQLNELHRNQVYDVCICVCVYGRKEILELRRMPAVVLPCRQLEGGRCDG